MAGDEESVDLMEGVNQVVTAINDLILQTTPAASGCCAIGGGTYPPSDNGTEGDPPPENWEDLDDAPGSPAYQSRKCKMANYIHEQFEDYIDQLRIYDVDAYAGGMTVTLITLLGGVAGQAIFPLVGAVAGATIGFLVGLALVIIDGGFDLPDLITIMAANEDELVCALYNTTSSSDGIEAYIDILETGGASAADILFIRAIVAIDFLNYLFFKRDPAVEAALGEYTGPVTCDPGCDPCDAAHFAWGSGNLEGGTISSEWDGSAHTIRFYLGAFQEVTLSSLTGWTEQVSAFDSFKASSGRDEDDCGDGWPGYDLYASDTNPFTPDWYFECVGTVYIFSATAFTFVLTIDGPGFSCP